MHCDRVGPLITRWSTPQHPRTPLKQRSSSSSSIANEVRPGAPGARASARGALFGKFRGASSGLTLGIYQLDLSADSGILQPANMSHF